MKRSYTDLSDSLFPFATTNNYSFLSADNINRYTSRLDIGGEEAFATILFRFEFDYDIYNRRIYTTSDLLSDLGGI